MERFYTSNVMISKGNENARSENQFFAVNLESKFFRATFAYAAIGSLKILHTFL